MKLIIPKDSITELIEDEFDFNYKADAVYISSLDEFDTLLRNPSLDNKHIYYRGERFNSLSRPLLPTIFRNREDLFAEGERATVIDANGLYDYFSNHSSYFDLYEQIIGAVQKDQMYSFLAFSQHYFGISPFIDFTKSLDVALSFALKDRKEFSKDIIIYTIELKNENDYTNSPDIANKWLNDYSVVLFNNTVSRLDIKNTNFKEIHTKLKGRSFLDLTSPSAKLIDVPTNDLMRFQQGVFLLLDDFSLIGNSYLTKKIRDEFVMKKWVISKDICPDLVTRLLDEKPYYSFKKITNLNAIVSDIKKEMKK